MVAPVHYRGDESGLPIEQAISDLAAWISNQEIKCYYYRPEPIDEEPLDDVLMVSFADSGSVMRERLITAIGEQQFSDEVLIVLREQLSIE